MTGGTISYLATEPIKDSDFPPRWSRQLMEDRNTAEQGITLMATVMENFQCDITDLWMRSQSLIGYGGVK